MLNEELRKKISDDGYENSVVYDAPYFDDSIVGIDSNGKTVYVYELMADEYVNDEFHSLESSDDYFDALSDAYQWIDYNTIRATPHMGPLAPIIISYNPEEEKWINLISLEEYDINDIRYDINKQILKELEL